MRVLVTGAGGQLGGEVCRELARRGVEYLGPASRELDMTDPPAVERLLSSYQPDAVIHCAAYTKVDEAEEDVGRCWSVNADGTRRLAEACRRLDGKLLYVSTDYVFRGDARRAYEVTDLADPCNVYGLSKLGGELAIRAFLKKYYIVRTSWLFGRCGRNFVEAMLQRADSGGTVDVVCDQVGSPTYAADLAPLLCEMIETERYGVYHASNEGSCSWAEFAEEIFRLSRKSATVRPVPTASYPARARRPLYTVMSTDSLPEAGFHRLSPWRDALARYLDCQNQDHM